jgi:hypothetical protein
LFLIFALGVTGETRPAAQIQVELGEKEREREINITLKSWRDNKLLLIDA